MEVHSYNSTTLKTEVIGSQVQCQPAWATEQDLSQNLKMKKKNVECTRLFHC